MKQDKVIKAKVISVDNVFVTVLCPYCNQAHRHRLITAKWSGYKTPLCFLGYKDYYLDQEEYEEEKKNGKE